MSNVTKATVATTILASAVLLSGCGLFTGEEKNKIDPPDVSLVDSPSKLEGDPAETTADENKESEEASVKTELYLIDSSGYVVPQTLALPSTQGGGVAAQSLKYLVEDGPVSNVLPSGFRAVLPAGTEVSVDIKDGTAVVDFSKEFKNYKKEDELKILQAVTWTLTQFDSVQTVKLKLNGTELKQMPVNGTPVQEGLSRASGINLDTSGVNDISQSKALTVYYIGGEEGNYYYVPITKRVNETDVDNVTAVVQELAKGPSHFSGLQSIVMSDVELLDEPQLADGMVTLNFNESILNSFKEKKVSQQVLDALVLSLTEQKGIERVELKVDGNADLLKEDGKPLSEPVSRPAKVNTGSF